MNSRAICTATVNGVHVKLYRDTLDDGTARVIGFTEHGQEYGLWRIEGMEEQTTITRPAIEQREDVLYADGWEDCLVGHGTIFHGSDGQMIVAIYDRNKILQRLFDDFVSTCEANNPGDTHEGCFHIEEADEYISFNIEGGFIKPGMPVFASFEAQPIVINESVQF
jgi:hypothetical protein